MLYYVYILKSEKDLGYYVGCTKNTQDRLSRHKRGLVTSTKYRLPVKLVYCESYVTLSEARLRENKIKSYKGGNEFKKIVSKV